MLRNYRLKSHKGIFFYDHVINMGLRFVWVSSRAIEYNKGTPREHCTIRYWLILHIFKTVCRRLQRTRPPWGQRGCRPDVVLPQISKKYATSRTFLKPHNIKIRTKKIKLSTAQKHSHNQIKFHRLDCMPNVFHWNIPKSKSPSKPTINHSPITST